MHLRQALHVVRIHWLDSHDPVPVVVARLLDALEEIHARKRQHPIRRPELGRRFREMVIAYIRDGMRVSAWTFQAPIINRAMPRCRERAATTP